MHDGGVVHLTVGVRQPINGAGLPTPATLFDQRRKVVPIEANAAPQQGAGSHGDLVNGDLPCCEPSPIGISHKGIAGDTLLSKYLRDHEEQGAGERCTRNK